jgi:hypothetical protein
MRSSGKSVNAFKPPRPGTHVEPASASVWYNVTHLLARLTVSPSHLFQNDSTNYGAVHRMGIGVFRQCS